MGAGCRVKYWVCARPTLSWTTTITQRASSPDPLVPPRTEMALISSTQCSTSFKGSRWTVVPGRSGDLNVLEALTTSAPAATAALLMVDVLMVSLKIALPVLYRFSMFCHDRLDFYRNLHCGRATLQD